MIPKGPRVVNRLLGPALGILLIVVLGYVTSTYWLYLLSGCLIFAIVAIGQGWLVGIAGQASFGGAAFMAIGAFASAHAAEAGWPVIATVILAGLIGAAVGLLVGLPSLRLAGFYLLLSTIALQAIVSFIGVRYEDNAGAGLNVGAPTLGPLHFHSDRSTYFLYAVALVLTMYFVSRAYKGAPGRAWRSIQESEIAAASAGVPVVRWKLSAFVWSSALTSGAGGLYAYYIGNVSYTTFDLALAVSIVTMVFVGGRRSMVGATLGAILVTLAPAGMQTLSNHVGTASSVGSFLSRNASTINIAIFSTALILILVLAPDGLAGILGGLLARATGRSGAAAEAAPDSAARAGGPGLAMVGGFGGAPSEDEAASPGPDRLVALAVDNLHVRYGNGAAALRGVSLTVLDGESLVVLGRNGAGKSTLLKAIAGFVPTERVQVSGRIVAYGSDLTSEGAIRRGTKGLLLVPERDKCFPHLTVREHMRLAGGQEDVLEIFAALGRRLTSAAGSLSGGERQMLALAMAVSRQPRVLLIDEMSLGLAPVMVGEVLNQVEQARRQFGMTVVLVDQDAATVVRAADRVCLLHEGQIVGLGAPGLLKASDISKVVLGEAGL